MVSQLNSKKLREHFKTEEYEKVNLKNLVMQKKLLSLYLAAYRKSAQYVHSIKLRELFIIMRMKGLILALFAITAVAAGCTAQTQASDKSNKSNKEQNKMGTVAITKAEFLTKVANFETTPNEWKYLGNKPALVDFYASWCGPCKMIAPILEDLATEYGDEIIIYKVDTERESELAAAFGIRSIPTLLFIPVDGQPQMSQGAMSKAQLQDAINKILLKK